ncbi:hypothetical protein D3C71_1869970 [compost metagenome]
MRRHGHQSDYLEVVVTRDLPQKIRHLLRFQPEFGILAGDVHLNKHLDVNTGRLRLALKLLRQRQAIQ